METPTTSFNERDHLISLVAQIRAGMDGETD